MARLWQVFYTSPDGEESFAGYPGHWLERRLPSRRAAVAYISEWLGFPVAERGQASPTVMSDEEVATEKRWSVWWSDKNTLTVVDKPGYGFGPEHAFDLQSQCESFRLPDGTPCRKFFITNDPVLSKDGRTIWDIINYAWSANADELYEDAQRQPRDPNYGYTAQEISDWTRDRIDRAIDEVLAADMIKRKFASDRWLKKRRLLLKANAADPGEVERVLAEAEARGCLVEVNYQRLDCATGLGLPDSDDPRDPWCVRTYNESGRELTFAECPKTPEEVNHRSCHIFEYATPQEARELFYEIMDRYAYARTLPDPWKSFGTNLDYWKQKFCRVFTVTLDLSDENNKCIGRQPISRALLPRRNPPYTATFLWYPDDGAISTTSTEYMEWDEAYNAAEARRYALMRSPSGDFVIRVKNSHGRTIGRITPHAGFVRG
jgi:hypothetical protein